MLDFPQPPEWPAPQVQVTAHAIERYRERVADVPAEQARAALDCPASRTAASIGAPFVKLPGGQRLVIRRGIIRTVLPAGQNPNALSLEKDLERV